MDTFRRGATGWPRALWIWIALAFLLRAGALWATRDISCIYDECFYSELARSLAAGEGFQPHARHYWPPGYVAFLAAHLVAGGGWLAAKATQVVLSTLLVPLVYSLARRAARSWDEVAGRRVALAAAAWIALHPTLVAYSHYLWSETLFLPIFTGGLLLAIAARDTASGGRAAAAGVLFGLSCLIKLVALFLVPLLAVWLLLGPGEPRQRLRGAVLLMLATFAVILPWTIRNAAVHGRFVLVETTTGKNLVRGNNRRPPANWDWGMERPARGMVRETGCNQVDLIDLNACLTRRGIEWIANHPGSFARRAGTKVADLVNPTSFLVRHVRKGVYGGWPPWLADATVLVVALYNMMLMALAVIGWTLGPPSSTRQAMALTTVYIVAVHVATFAMSRFRLPLEPFLAVGAALVLRAPGAFLAELRGGRRRLATFALLVALAACWSVRAGALYYEPPDRGSRGVDAPPLGGH
jgi:4-amino-4-deoxy-L-arabinose transferase-like glycosyltransferase